MSLEGQVKMARYGVIPSSQFISIPNVIKSWYKVLAKYT